MNSKISLFVLAAGMGSRYGGLKQMEGFGPSGETIIDYSIYDAVRAGFDKFVFVIRPDMEEAFNEIFMTKYKNKIDISYVFQTLDMVPDWYKLNPERTKPWGTGQALLVAREALREPFLVINGDDFYSQESFKVAAKFLRESCTPTEYAIPAYRLENVLSENGGVKRGICAVENGYLIKIEETFEVEREEDGIVRGITWDGRDMEMKDGDYASMNLFCVHNDVFDNLERRFEEFLKTNEDELTGEFLLPTIFSDMVEDGDVKFKVIETGGKWFGVTYQEDAPIVREKLRKLVDEGIYPEKLEL